MNILKPDSPVMEFLRTVTNLIIVDLLCVLCCIPVITFGAAVSAKYYVSMKIIRGEGSGVVGPFFKSFAQNFKRVDNVPVGSSDGVAKIGCVTFCNIRCGSGTGMAGNDVVGEVSEMKRDGYILTFCHSKVYRV